MTSESERMVPRREPLEGEASNLAALQECERKLAECRERTDILVGSVRATLGAELDAANATIERQRELLRQFGDEDNAAGRLLDQLSYANKRIDSTTARAERVELDLAAARKQLAESESLRIEAINVAQAAERERNEWRRLATQRADAAHARIEQLQQVEARAEKAQRESDELHRLVEVWQREVDSAYAREDEQRARAERLEAVLRRLMEAAVAAGGGDDRSLNTALRYADAALSTSSAPAEPPIDWKVRAEEFEAALQQIEDADSYAEAIDIAHEALSDPAQTTEFDPEGPGWEMIDPPLSGTTPILFEASDAVFGLLDALHDKNQELVTYHWHDACFYWGRSHWRHDPPVVSPAEQDQPWLRPLLDPFVAAMRAKLLANAHKGDSWKRDTYETLLPRLQEEVDEVHACTTAAGAMGELADVANICAMLYDLATAEQDHAEGECEHCGELPCCHAPAEPEPELRSKLAELTRLLDSPEVNDFMAAVPREAAHQVKRWGTEHDAGKAPEDWLWLLGYLAGKAVQAQRAGDLDKAKHHTISTAAACLNWHRHITGSETTFRPGIEPPAEPPTPPAEPSIRERRIRRLHERRHDLLDKQDAGTISEGEEIQLANIDDELDEIDREQVREEREHHARVDAKIEAFVDKHYPPAQPDAAGLHHDRVHTEVGEGRAARTRTRESSCFGGGKPLPRTIITDKPADTTWEQDRLDEAVFWDTLNAEPDLPDYVRAAGYECDSFGNEGKIWMALWNGVPILPSEVRIRHAKAEAIADAVAHYREHNDPPGLRLTRWGRHLWDIETPDGKILDLRSSQQRTRAFAWEYYRAHQAGKDHENATESNVRAVQAVRGVDPEANIRQPVDTVPGVLAEPTLRRRDEVGTCEHGVSIAILCRQCHPTKFETADALSMITPIGGTGPIELPKPKVDPSIGWGFVSLADLDAFQAEIVAALYEARRSLVMDRKPIDDALFALADRLERAGKGDDDAKS